MTSPSTFLHQWLQATTARATAAVAQPARLAPIATVRRAEPDDYAWATGNVRRHIVRMCARAGILVALDVIALTALHALLYHTRELPLFGSQVLAFAHAQAAAGSLAGWGQCGVALILALAATGNYGAGDRRRDPGRLFVGCAFGTSLVAWGVIWRHPLEAAPAYFGAVVLLVIALVLMRGLADITVRYVRPVRSAAARTMLIGRAEDCLALLGRPAFADEYGFGLVGFVDTEKPTNPTAAGTLADLERTLRAERVDTVVLCGAVDEETTAQVVRAATIAQCEVLAASRTLELAGIRPEVVCRHGQPFIELRPAALRGNQLFAKRALDLVVGSAALLVFAPVMLLIVAAIRLESRGPAVFGQRRAGRYSRPFRCYKFRSMRMDAEQILRADPELYAEYLRNDYKLPPEKDPRITRVGRFLRTTSLDELPQLWNVVKGDMSLVGPRAVVIDELRHYGAEQRLFLSLKPGVTGVWQVNGRSKVHYPHRTLVELGYVRSWSLGRDVGIMLQTVPAVLSRRGAY
jgi:exopolysaccharide production protein ExoY